MARRRTVPSLPAWTYDLPVHERTLANGLKALVLPRPSSIVVCDLFYPAGAVDEPPGRSGLAHFVEHMLFKGTPRFPKGQIDRLAYLAAGQANAETGEDDTHYYFSFPADRWEVALAIEADRLQNALFDPVEVEAERHVITEERARDLDSPLGRLDQAHRAVSYLVHPYRNPILGWPDDLRRLTIDDLRTFYETHYRPDGAVLTIVGAVDPAAALDRVEAHFGGLPRGRILRPEPATGEPAQRGRREVRIEGSDSVSRAILGWRTVAERHADGPTLDVLSDLLTCGRRSRLWSKLVEQDRLAVWVDAAQETAHYAGQFVVQVEAVPGVEPSRIEEAVRGAILELAEQGPTAEELARSRARLEAAWRWEQDDLSGLASGLGHVALWDDWRAWPREHQAALAVTADDIIRAASSYLVDDGLTVAWSLPGTARVAMAEVPKKGPRFPTPPAPEMPEPIAIPHTASCLEDYKPRREVLANGLRLLTDRRRGTGTVVLDLYVDSGQLRELKPGVAHLAGRLREEGTLSRSADELAGAIEDVGGTLDIGATGVTARVRSEDLPLAVELMADVILRPSFPADDLPWTRRRTIAELQGDRDDPAFRADQLFRSLVYGDHPYGRDSRGAPKQIQAISRDDILEHDRRLTTPSNAYLVAAGDFDPRRLRSLVARHLGDWKDRARKPTKVAAIPRIVGPKVRRVSWPGEQVQIVMGHLGIRRDDPDFDALCLVDLILGSGPGFCDRLSRILRDELGLVYAVGGGITDSADLEPGLLRISLATGPDEADRAVEAVMEQVRAIHLGAFDDDEIERARRYLVGSWVFDYQSVSQRADRLLELERFGLPLDEPQRWAERIARLTPRQVRAAARRHLDPTAMVRVEFGPVRARVRKSGRECA